MSLFGLSNVQAQSTRAVEDDQDLINWYYAATYGTGIYKAGDRTVGVLQVPLSYTLRESGEGHWGLRFTLPVSFGFYDISLGDVVDQGLPSRINTMSLLPGLELEKRISPRWLLKPYVSAGAGWELGGEESAWIYDLGFRSRYRIGSDRGTVLSLVNRLSLAGYYPSGGPREPLGLFAVGLDVQVPTGREILGRPIVISILPVYYYYFHKLGFAEIQDRDNTVREEAEFAVSLLAKQPFKILGMDVDRVGIAVRSGGGVTGYRFFTTLPF